MRPRKRAAYRSEPAENYPLAGELAVCERTDHVHGSSQWGVLSRCSWDPCCSSRTQRHAIRVSPASVRTVDAIQRPRRRRLCHQAVHLGVAVRPSRALRGETRPCTANPSRCTLRRYRVSGSVPGAEDLVANRYRVYSDAHTGLPE